MNLNITPKTQTTRPAANAARGRKVVLKVDKLVKIYGKRTVVNGVSFEVCEGEVVGLLGANGAGKTTSFRMSCGLIPANSGTVMLNGIDVTTWPMHRRTREGRLGYLPQDRSTFGSLTTEENLYAAMEFYGYSRAEMKRRCEAALKRFNLLHIRNTKVGMGGSGGLSGGERRRLEIARALLADPKILLLDEPFANVDPLTVEEMQKVIRELADSGVAVLITDHQVDETLAITDRSYIVCKGEVLCSGTPLEVLTNDKAVKTYFGDKAQFSLQRFQQNPNSSLVGRSRANLGGSAAQPSAQSSTQPRPAQENASDAKVSERLPFRPALKPARELDPASREESSDAPSTAANAANQAAAPDRKASPSERPSLTLNRRNVGEVKQTPSPRDEEREPNRFEGKIGKLFRRKS